MDEFMLAYLTFCRSEMGGRIGFGGGGGSVVNQERNLMMRRRLAPAHQIGWVEGGRVFNF